MSGALSFLGSEMKSRGLGGGGTETSGKDGLSSGTAAWSDAVGAAVGLPPGEPLPPAMTAAVTMPATARAASAPPPIHIQRLRRACASLSSASAPQSGVDDDEPPGPSNGPPCPKLMPRILMGLVERVEGGHNPAHGTS